MVLTDRIIPDLGEVCLIPTEQGVCVCVSACACACACVCLNIKPQNLKNEGFKANHTSQICFFPRRLT